MEPNRAGISFHNGSQIIQPRPSNFSLAAPAEACSLTAFVVAHEEKTFDPLISRKAQSRLAGPQTGKINPPCATIERVFFCPHTNQPGTVSLCESLQAAHGSTGHKRDGLKSIPTSFTTPQKRRASKERMRRQRAEMSLGNPAFDMGSEFSGVGF